MLIGTRLKGRKRIYLWLLVKAGIPCLLSTECPSDICLLLRFMKGRDMEHHTRSIKIPVQQV